MPRIKELKTELVMLKDETKDGSERSVSAIILVLMRSIQESQSCK